MSLETSNIFKCIICENEFCGFGNSPNPVKMNGKCCDLCNSIHVIPTRIKCLQIGTCVYKNIEKTK